MFLLNLNLSLDNELKETLKIKKMFKEHKTKC